MTEQGQVVAVRQYVIAQFREAGTGIVTIASGGVGVGGTGGGGAVDSVNGQTGTVVLDAADIAITDAANDFTASDVEGALAELQSDAEADATALSDHVADATAAHAASAISFTPNGSIAATDVQAAIQEVRDEAAGATDLAWDAATSKVTSNTGTDATLTAVDGSNPGLMTVAQKSKLDGIEAGATADMTGAEILAALVTVDGAGSGLDADTLDGTSSAGFATASHNHSGVYDPAGTAAGLISDTAYDATSWNGDTTHAPSKNAVRDKIETLAAPAASAVTLTDAGSYFTTDNVEAALQQLGPAISTAQLQKLTAGFTANLGWGDKWRGGTGKIGTRITRALTTGSTTCGLLDPLTADTMPARNLFIDDEIVYCTSVTAGRSVTDGVLNSTTALTSATASFTSADVGRLVVATGVPADTYIDAYVSGTQVTLSAAATATASSVSVTFGPLLNLVRGEEGSTAASHSASAEITRRRRRVVAVMGDSIVEGTQTDTSRSNDPWVDRFHRSSGERYGGVLGKAWPNWRSTAGGSPHHEWTTPVSAASVAGTTSEVGYGGTYAATQVNSGTANFFKWLRPGGETVQAIRFFVVDVGTASCQGSYSLDAGSTWTDFPLTSRYSSGTGILRSFLVACDNPDDVRVRAATAAGTGKTIVIPSVPICTYATYPHPLTDGMDMLNFGWGGIKLRQTINARTSTDAVVTNGSATVTSATATFVTLDAGSTVYLEGVAYTISTRDSATQITLTGNYAGTTGTGKRITIFSGDGTTDRLALLTGHPASARPDLVILGPFTNDFVATATSLGDANEYAYYDFMTYTVKRLKAAGANVVLVACYERNTATSNTSGVQLAYRNMLATVATEQTCALFNIYDSMSAFGVTGYTATNAQGWLADGTHPSESGHQFIGARFTTMLEFA